MKYLVVVHDRTFEVTVDGDRVSVDGRAGLAELSGIPETPLRQLVLDGRSRLVAATPAEEGWIVQLGGERWTVAVEDERAHALRELTGQRHRRGAAGLIRAPMPGLVLRVEVEEGQVLEAGAGVVVLEAMKMENEITTPGPGTVTKVHVQPGEAVEKGAALVEVGS